MKKFTIAIVLLFVLVSFASALDLKQNSMDVAVIPEFNQPANVPVTISGADPGSYVIYTLTAVRVLPSDSFNLYSGNNDLTFDVYPTSQLVAQGPAAYSFAIGLRNTGTNLNYNGTMTVRVVRIEDALAISSDSNSPESSNISFFIQNKEGIDLKNVHAEFSSVFFDVNQVFDLNANSNTVISINVPKSKLEKIEAGAYLLKAVFQTDRGAKTLEGRIYLGQKVNVETEDGTSGILIRTHEVSKTNRGNVNEDVVINVEKDIISRLFTSFNIEPDSTSRSGFWVTYSWAKKLGPTESLDVKVTTNYLLPILIIIAIILIVWGIKRYTQTKMLVEKSVVPVKTSSGQFALKVKLHVKAVRRASNVSLIDRIPGIVQVYEKAFGIIKPTKIDSNNKRLQWDIGDMAPGEERSFSYIVYSTVGVVGKFALPQALAVFEKDGQIHEVESNVVYFLAEQRAPEF